MNKTLASCGMAVLAILATACHRQPPASRSYDGTWVMTLGNRVLIVLTLEQKNGAFSGSFSNPKSFEMPMGKSLRFSHVVLPVTERRIARATVDGSHLHIVVDDPANPNEPDEYDMTLAGDDQAFIQLSGVPVAPLPFTRSRSADTPRVATDWDPQQVYTARQEPVTSNAEMKRLFDEDQRARQDFLNMSADDWEVVSKDDAARRQRTHALLTGGQLHSAEDFREAAFIFQHGDTSDDYLLAHTLAMIAVAKGDAGALWIGTATLDRYLHSIQRPQIYGTQFLTPDKKPVTQEPYDRQLIPDLLREELGVPELAAQRDQLKAWQEQATAKAARPK